MKLKVLAGIILLIAILLVFLNRRPEADDQVSETPTSKQEQKKQEVPETPKQGEPIGNQFLEKYGDPSTPPALDMEKVARVVEGISTLIKNIDTRLIATNEQLSAFLQGGNNEGMVYVSPDQPLFDDEGLLIDRWGSPLIIHPLGTNIIEIRSSGPDKTPYTADDLIRAPEGGVYKGSDPRSRPSLAP